MPLFTQPELASYLAETPLKDAVRAQLLSELAEGLITARLSDDVNPAHLRVKAIALEVTARAYRNPEGYIDESVDDWRGRLPDDVARAGVFLTLAEGSELDSLSPTVRRKVRSTRLVADSTRPHVIRLPTP